MKKIISLALSLSMLACMATNAFALEKEHIIGTRGQYGDVSDGASGGTAFIDPEIEVSIQVETASVESRYAVDIEYEKMSLYVNGAKMVWNVNDLEYQPADGSSATLENNLWFEATVVNYSDQKVYVTASVADLFEDANDDGIDVAVVRAVDVSDTATIEGTPVNDAKDCEDTDSDGKRDISNDQKLTFAIMVSCEDWDEAARFHANALGTSDAVQVATCHINVSKDPTT